MSLARGIGVIFALEMRQRVRGVAWYVLLGVFVVLVGVVTGLVWFGTSAFGGSAFGSESGGPIFSTIIYFVLLLGTLVTPALSGNAINGDRDAGTLATTQVTLVTTGQIVLGKFIAAWVTALAFLIASLPFVLMASALGGLELDVFLVSIPVLAVELGVVAAIGVGLSGLLARPLFSVVVSYLVVAALSVGTLIAFGLGTLVVQSPSTYTSSYATEWNETTGVGTDCAPPVTEHGSTPRPDLFWGVLAANPYVILADAVPTHLDARGYPDDLFGSIKWGVRQLQVPPDLDVVWNDCAPMITDDGPTPREVIDATVPSWFVGLGAHLVLAAAALLGAWAKLRTPARRLGPGSRIA